ncbi:MAG: nucleoside-diphosphate-sugar epimerase, partial [Candidatus Krumholzibacteriia bacterium]
MNVSSETQSIWRKVLVTGGSGFNGINLIRDLLERGVSVRSLDLAEFTYDDCKDRIETIVGDIRDPEVVAAAMEGVDLVIHTAMALPLYSEQDILTT